MKQVTSKKAKGKKSKKNKKDLKRYWNVLYPESYVNVLVQKDNSTVKVSEVDHND